MKHYSDEQLYVTKLGCDLRCKRPVPAELNGHRVIRWQAHDGCFTVMVLRPSEVCRWVVATWWPDLGASWCWGHYCNSQALADATFEEVAKRNDGR